MSHKIADLARLFLDGEEHVVKEFKHVFDRVLEAKLQTAEGRAYIAAKLSETAKPSVTQGSPIESLHDCEAGGGLMRWFLLIATVLAFFCGCESAQWFSLHRKTPDRSRPTPTHQVFSVLAFTADWCQVCQRDKPKLGELRRQGVDVVEIDYDARPDLVRKYRVRRLPTYIVIEDGKEVERTESILVLIKRLRFLLRLF